MLTGPTGAKAIHRREREIVALIYVFAIAPVFGILVAGIIALAFKERSRTVVFHAKQAIAGQAFFLLVSIVLCLLGLFAMLVGVLSPGLRRILLAVDKVAFYALIVVYVLCCSYYAWMSLEGRDAEAPLIGARLRERGK